MLSAMGSYLSDLDPEDPSLSHLTWSPDDLRVYLRMAALSVFAAVPGRFGYRHFAVPDGPFVDLGPECVDVLSVQGVQHADGTFSPLVRLVRKRREIPITSREMCPPLPGPYRVRMITVTLDPAAPRNLTVDPQLPPGASLVLVCSRVPSTDGLEILIDEALEPVLFNWALSYAFGTEFESGTARQRSDTLWNHGSDLLGLSRATAKAVRDRAVA